MKKRLLSLVLCLVMVFSLFPAFGMNALADEPEAGTQNDMGYVKLPTPNGGWTADQIAAWNWDAATYSGYDPIDSSFAGKLFYYDSASGEYYEVTAEKKPLTTQVAYKDHEPYLEFVPANFPCPNNSDAEGLSTEFYVYDNAGNLCVLQYDVVYRNVISNYIEYMSILEV